MQLDTSKSQIPIKGLFLPPDPTPSFTPFVHIKVLNCDIVVEALVDIGAFVYFKDKIFATKHKIMLVEIVPNLHL